MIVIEHDLDVIRNADYIIDMGPEGGEAGGRIVAVGTPEQVAENETVLPGNSYVEDNLFSLIPSCIPQYSPLQ